jgi:hypothetical protein
MLEDYKKLPRVTRAIGKGAAMILSSSYAAALTNQTFDLRNALPEPFDYPQHASNVAIGAVIGTLIGNASAALYEKFGPRDDQAHGRVRAAAAVGASVVGLAINAVFETRTGIRLLHLESIAGTPDILDFAYGVGSSAASGAIAPTFNFEQKPVA